MWAGPQALLLNSRAHQHVVTGLTAARIPVLLYLHVQRGICSRHLALFVMPPCVGNFNGRNIKVGEVTQPGLGAGWAVWLTGGMTLQGVRDRLPSQSLPSVHRQVELGQGVLECHTKKLGPVCTLRHWGGQEGFGSNLSVQCMKRKD